MTCGVSADPAKSSEIHADQPSRDRPIAIDTAAWLGSTTGRPT
jgi:hypothetical protein